MTDQPRIGFAVFYVVTAGCPCNEFTCIDERKIVLEGKALAVGCERHLPAEGSQRAENIPHTFERLDTIKVRALVDRALLFKYCSSFLLRRVRYHKLERLVAVESGVELERLIRHAVPVALQGSLQTAQILRNAVDERPFDVKYETGKHYALPSEVLQ